MHSAQNYSPLFAVCGDGGHGREMMPFAALQILSLGISIERLVFIGVATTTEKLNAFSVISHDDFLEQAASEKFMAIAIGDSKLRQKIFTRWSSFGIKPWEIRAPNAYIAASAQIGPGCQISPQVVVNANAVLGSHVQINTGCNIAHDCWLGDYVTLAPGVLCNGNVRIEQHAYIGSGAILRNGTALKPLIIGEGAIVGMGAVVTKDVPAGTTVVGNPAKPINK